MPTIKKCPHCHHELEYVRDIYDVLMAANHYLEDDETDYDSEDQVDSTHDHYECPHCGENVDLDNLEENEETENSLESDLRAVFSEEIISTMQSSHLTIDLDSIGSLLQEDTREETPPRQTAEISPEERAAVLEDNAEWNNENRTRGQLISHGYSGYHDSHANTDCTERIVKCPRCGRMSVMKGEEETINCVNCGKSLGIEHVVSQISNNH